MLKSTLAFAVLMSIMPATLLQASELPDEINHPPYYSQYQDLRGQRDNSQNLLDSQRSNLQRILDSIQRENDNISRLQQSISNLENEKSNLEYELPQVQNDLSQTEMEASNTSAVINELSNRLSDVSYQLQNERNKLGAMETDLNQVVDDQRQTGNRLRASERQYNQLSRNAADLDAKIKKAEAQIDKSEKIIQSLIQEQAKIEKLIARANQEIGRSKVAVQAAQKQFKDASDQSNAVEKKLSKSKEELKKAQAEGNAGKVEKLKQRVQKLSENLKKANEEESKAKKVLQKEKRDLAAVEDELKKLEGQKRQIPKQIADEEAFKAKAHELVRQSKRALVQTNRELSESEAGLVQLRRRLKRLEVQASRISSDIRVQATVVSNIEANYNSLSSDIQNHRIHLNGLNSRIASLNRRVNDINVRIPEINSEIDSNFNYISESERSIRDLELSQGQTEIEIATLEANVADLTAQTNNANSEYTQRQNLYNRYLQEASDIGSSQTDPAVGLGKDKGSEIADVTSTKYADQLGLEVGTFEANLIAMVRGENQGYPVGYQRGHTDSTSRQQGQIEGRVEGAKQAHVYAQQNLKPGFFEKHLVSVLNGQKLAIKSMKSLTLEMPDEAYSLKGYKILDFLGSVASLSQEEIQTSYGYETSLDDKISEALNSEGQIWERSRSYSNSDFVYEAPTTIPYQSVNCSTVYKNVSDFISECEQSYASVFKDKFLAESDEQFDLEYPELYNEKFAAKESAVRAESYPARFESALDIATAKAFADGKKDAFDEEFKTAYDVSYESEMPQATAKADSDAKVEVQSWLQSNPVVTVGSHSFSSEVVRGGMGGDLKLVLKNLGSKNSIATGAVKILSSSNLIFSSSAYRLSDVAANSNKAFEIPFKVNGNARSGELATASVEITLPGDKYKATRVETKSFSIKLSVNPTANTSLKYDATPNIKGIRSYYIHMFDFNIAPKVENVSEGYTVKLTAAPNSTSYLSFKETQATSRGLRQGQSFTGRFRYVFNKSADGKVVTLYLNIYHKGILVEQKPIELRPH